ncbi:MAG: protein tyrosine phosphatase family protein [Pseudohongiella sp.]|uniref:protein tyrosine phosphatase family protein n=1 Tax=Pseudohongiella sp. TaxID=1979412 RepID=UPI0034A012C5
MIKKGFILLISLFFSASLLAAETLSDNTTLADVFNFRQYSDTFASAGQPTAEQFSKIRDAGYERVVYIAFTNNQNALANADQIVKGLGMDYIHIPVDWNNPTKRDFYAFADTMQREPDMKTLLHCQVNARATAFSFLYRVIYEDVPVAQAKADMNTVWQPNETWRDLIFAVLAENNISPECEGCDWTPSTADD